MAYHVLHLLADSDLPKQARFLYLTLAQLADPTTAQIAISIPDLAELTRMSDTTVRKFTRLLAREGWLTILSQYPNGSTHSYHLLKLPSPDEQPPTTTPPLKSKTNPDTPPSPSIPDVLYDALSRLADPHTRTVEISITDLARLTGKSANTVRKYTHQMEKDGWFTIERRYDAHKHQHFAPVYHLLHDSNTDAVPPASPPPASPTPLEVQTEDEFEAPFRGKFIFDVPNDDTPKSSLNLSTKSSIQEKLFQEKNEKPKKQKKPQRYDTDPDFKAFVDKFSEVTSCLIVQLPTLWRTYRADLEKLWDMQYGIQDLEAFERWWKSQDWRGMQGQQAGPRDVLHHILTARQKYKPVSVIALKERYADLIGD